MHLYDRDATLSCLNVCFYVYDFVLYVFFSLYVHLSHHITLIKITYLLLTINARYYAFIFMMIHNTFLVLSQHMVRGGRVVRGWTLRSRGRGSTPARGCCVPTPTQRAIPLGSVNE